MRGVWGFPVHRLFRERVSGVGPDGRLEITLAALHAASGARAVLEHGGARESLNDNLPTRRFFLGVLEASIDVGDGCSVVGPVRIQAINGHEDQSMIWTGHAFHIAATRQDVGAMRRPFCNDAEWSIPRTGDSTSWLETPPRSIE